MVLGLKLVTQFKRVHIYVMSTEIANLRSHLSMHGVSVENTDKYEIYKMPF